LPDRFFEHFFLLLTGKPPTAAEAAVLNATLVAIAEHGLVRRLPSPDDRRGVLVELTVEGLARVDAALVTLLSAEQELLGGLPDGEVRTLADLLRNVLAPFDAS